MTEGAEGKPPIAPLPGKMPVGRAWNQFVMNPSSVRRAVRVIIAAYVTAMLVGGTVIWLVDPGDYPDPWRAFWYVLQTITTVGYGDATPTEPIGKVVGAIIMLIAIAGLSILTAFITSAFVEARQHERREQTRSEQVADLEEVDRRLTEILARLERIERQGRTQS